VAGPDGTRTQRTAPPGAGVLVLVVGPGRAAEWLNNRDQGRAGTAGVC
jgi:hypothetical protein